MNNYNNDQYNVTANQIGVVGGRASLQHAVLHQAGGPQGQGLPQLAAELRKLRKMLHQADEDHIHDAEIGALAEAEEAAMRGDTHQVSERLRKVGTWVLEFVREVGAHLVGEAIKGASPP